MRGRVTGHHDSDGPALADGILLDDATVTENISGHREQRKDVEIAIPGRTQQIVAVPACERIRGGALNAPSHGRPDNRHTTD